MRGQFLAQNLGAGAEVRASIASWLIRHWWHNVCSAICRWSADALTMVHITFLQHDSYHHTNRTGCPRSWRQHGVRRRYAGARVRRGTAARQCVWRCVPDGSRHGDQWSATKDIDHRHAIARWPVPSSYRAAASEAELVDTCDPDEHNSWHAMPTVSTVQHIIIIIIAYQRSFCCSLLLARLMGQYCFARWRLSASSVICNAAGGRAGGPAAWAVGRPALYGGPVRLRPVRATPCYHGRHITYSSRRQ